MPNVPFSRLEAQVGDAHRTVEGFAVEAGKVAEFAAGWSRAKRPSAGSYPPR